MQTTDSNGRRSPRRFLPHVLVAALLGVLAAAADPAPAAAPQPALSLSRGATERAEALLDAATPLDIGGSTRRCGTVAVAVAGTDLAVRVFVRDVRAQLTANNWAGVVELYGAPERGGEVRHLLFAVENHIQKGTVKSFVNGTEQAEPPAVAWKVTPEDRGYCLQATVPFAFFGWAAEATTVLLNVAVTTVTTPGAKPQTVLLYPADHVARSSAGYGRATITPGK